LDKRGKFGRILGEIIADGVNINQLMIEEHMAVEYHGQSKTDIHKEHMFNRQELNRAGIEYS
jgi:endonuclease YncB( thermonuclease family)